MLMEKRKFDTLLFDLDGTLVDSSEGITDSVRFALEHYGIHPSSREELYRFIGPPLVDSFMRFCGFSREQAGEATDIYRSRYRVKGVYENRVYDGIKETLSALNEMGVTCALATSKPEIFANTVLDDMGLRPYISFAAGAELDDAEGRKRRLRSEKAEVVAYALESLGAADKTRVLMVGDRLHDIEGARANAIPSAGVLWGFGNREELETAGADYIVNSPSELIGIVLGQALSRR